MTSGDEANAGCAFFFFLVFSFLLFCFFSFFKLYPLPSNLSLGGAALLTLSILKVVGIQFLCY